MRGSEPSLGETILFYMFSIAFLGGSSQGGSGFAAMPKRGTMLEDVVQQPPEHLSCIVIFLLPSNKLKKC